MLPFLAVWHTKPEQHSTSPLGHGSFRSPQEGAGGGVGALEGLAVGFLLGPSVGELLGAKVGSVVGPWVGGLVGVCVGDSVLL